MSDFEQNFQNQTTQFCLRWNNYFTNILGVITEQLSEENFTDVTISCDGKYFKAHKLVLSACSPYFKEIFKESNTPHSVVIVADAKFSDMEQILEFIYCGEVNVLHTELQSLFDLAESLQIKGLSNAKKKYEKRNLSKTRLKMEAAQKSEALNPLMENKDYSLEINMSSTEEETPILIKATVSTAPDNRISHLEQAPSQHPSSERNIHQNTSTSSQINYQIKVLKSPTRNVLRKSLRKSKGFLLFSNKWKSKLAKVYQNDSSYDISRRLLMMWRSLGKETKENYRKIEKRIIQFKELDRIEMNTSFHDAGTEETEVTDLNPLHFLKVLVTNNKDENSSLAMEFDNSEFATGDEERNFKVEEEVEIKEEVNA